MSRLFCSASLALLLFGLMIPPALAAPANIDEDPATETSETAAETPAEEELPADASPAEEGAAEKENADKEEDAEENGTAQEKDADEEEPTPKPTTPTPKPETHKVSHEPLVLKLSLDGVFATRRTHELDLRPEVWSSFKVSEAADHGDRVDKGQVVVRFESEDIDRAIADLKRDLELSKLTLQVAELEMQTLEQLMPMSLEAVERRREYTKEDREYYLETEAPLNRRIADAMLKQARQTLEYQREELAQLEKMYNADELTEETEEIVLRRARDAVERAEFLVERTEILHERTVEVELPRREVSVKENAERSVLDNKLTEATLPLQIEQARLQFEQAKVARDRSEKRLANLESDRELITIKAPTEGVVYYGRCVDGDWQQGSSADNLRPGGSIPANDVFVTIVEPRPLIVRASVAEKHLGDLRQGLQGTATPAAFPEMRLPVRTDRVARVPDAGTKFDAEFRVELDLEADPIMPGMTCKMEFTPYRQRQALVVPSKAVFTDEWDLQKKYVWLFREGSKPRRRAVVLGRQTGDKTEVVEGLKAGDEILLKAP